MPHIGPTQLAAGRISDSRVAKPPHSEWKFACLDDCAAALVRPDRDRSFATQDVLAVGEDDEDAVDAGQVGDGGLPAESMKMPKVSVSPAAIKVMTVGAAALVRKRHGAG